MRICLLLVYSLLVAGQGHAQNSGFLFIESQNGLPFYIRSRDSLYHSAPEGYLLLAPLNKLEGDLILGFPGQTAAAFVFSIPSPHIDKGWILRDMKQEGWRLYDSRLNELVPTRRLGSGISPYLGMLKRTDEFAVRLSQVVSDSAVLYYKPRPVPAVTVAAEPMIRLISKKETPSVWVLVYEVREGELIDRIELEIPRQLKEDMQ